MSTELSLSKSALGVQLAPQTLLHVFDPLNAWNLNIHVTISLMTRFS
jgi:hypothetical protein